MFTLSFLQTYIYLEITISKYSNPREMCSSKLKFLILEIILIFFGACEVDGLAIRKSLGAHKSVVSIQCKPDYEKSVREVWVPEPIQQMWAAHKGWNRSFWRDREERSLAPPVPPLPLKSGEGLMKVSIKIVIKHSLTMYDILHKLQ